MSYIFYDLETSEKDFCGYILNYCFIHTDEHFNIKSTLKGLVRPSKLKLPRVGALLANRILMQEHSNEAKDSERDAMIRIKNYIENVIDVDKNTTLIGYNSAKFDLPFLRFSFLRYGLNPYFYGKLKYQDLLHMVRYGVVKGILPKPKKENKLSLTLENTANLLGVLDGEQLHESEFDVKLTIDLAKELEEKYDISLSEFKAFENDYQSKVGEIVNFKYPDYSCENDFILKHYLIIDENASYIKAIQISENSSSIYSKFFKKKQDYWFKDQSTNFNSEFDYDIKKIPESFLLGGTFLRNKNLDIDSDLYGLSFKELGLLNIAIVSNNYEELLKQDSKDLYSLYKRYQVENHIFGEDQDLDLKIQKTIYHYAGYRYSGEFAYKSFGNNILKYPSFKDFQKEIEDSKSLTSNKNDLEIIQDLVEYIKKSNLYEFGLKYLN